MGRAKQDLMIATNEWPMNRINRVTTISSDHGNIYIGLGANLPSASGNPIATLEAALLDMTAAGITLLRRSPWYESAPVPRADEQPWYVNGVVEVATTCDPAALLSILQSFETASGRVRSVANAARPLDLDIIAYRDLVNSGPRPPLLPHPRMQDRAFVLLPLQAISPHWRHPIDGRSVGELICAMPAGQEIRLL
jgi:2-amino-4-hydroxy-6-hydroxymethyldihydropteridine diphosphokinase